MYVTAPAVTDASTMPITSIDDGGAWVANFSSKAATNSAAALSRLSRAAFTMTA